MFDRAPLGCEVLACIVGQCCCCRSFRCFVLCGAWHDSLSRCLRPYSKLEPSAFPFVMAVTAATAEAIPYHNGCEMFLSQACMFVYNSMHHACQWWGCIVSDVGYRGETGTPQRCACLPACMLVSGRCMAWLSVFSLVLACVHPRHAPVFPLLSGSSSRSFLGLCGLGLCVAASAGAVAWGCCCCLGCTRVLSCTLLAV